MAKKPPGDLQIAVSAKLRAVQDELGKTDEMMAKIVGVGRTTWTNWVNMENMPEEEAMVRLCAVASITMDWLYRNNPKVIPVGHAIRLTARLQGINPDNASPEQMAKVAADLAAAAV